MEDLLAMIKLTVGDLTPGTEMDGYYKNFLRMASTELSENDISKDVLASELGKTTIVLYAVALMEKRDIATDSTITLLKNNLSARTKGERYADGA